jgi:hypothetical protein
MSKRTLLILFFALLLILHQDSWWRDDATLVFGVFPVSLAYHVGWTLLVAVGWFLVTRFCWPDHLEDQSPPPSNGEADPKPEHLPR